MFVALGQGLFYAEAGISFLGTRLQTRMTVVALPSGGVAVISPLHWTEDLGRALTRIGPVRHVLSPNKIHNLGLSSFAAAYPDAEFWASPGLPERRPDLVFAGTLNDVPHPDWAGVLEQTTTAGNLFFSEVVFFHRATTVVIVADLVEHLTRDTVSSTWGRFMLGAMRLMDRTLPSPEFRMFTDDAKAAAERLALIDAWSFTRILPAHGSILDDTDHARFRAVRDILLREVAARPPWRKALYRWLSRHQ